MTSSATVRPSDSLDLLDFNYYKSDRVNFPIQNILKKDGARTVGDLLGYSERDLLSLKGIGKAYIASIKLTLEQDGYALRKET